LSVYLNGLKTDGITKLQGKMQERSIAGLNFGRTNNFVEAIKETQIKYCPHYSVMGLGQIHWE